MQSGQAVMGNNGFYFASVTTKVDTHFRQTSSSECFSFYTPSSAPLNFEHPQPKLIVPLFEL